jgi:hypothetical protein
MMAQSTAKEHTKSTVKTEQQHSIFSDTIKLPEVTCEAKRPIIHRLEGVISVDIPQIKQQGTQKLIDEKAAGPPVLHKYKVREWLQHLFRKRQK